MLSVDQALAHYRVALRTLGIDTVHLNDAGGRVLARTLRSQLDLPPMRQSAMDGYALLAADLLAATAEKPVSLPVSQTVPAGKNGQVLAQGSCARIFTGAPLPPGSDTVELQENVQRVGSGVSFTSPCVPGSHVREQGEELSAGQPILASGTALDAHSLSLAAACGHAYLPCHREPRVAVIVTGDELVAPGSARLPAQIFESNGQFLRHFLLQEHAKLGEVRHCRDDATSLSQQLSELLNSHDLILISGGASVGDKDYSRAAAAASGVDEVFWKVAQKPGKPLSFGVGPRGQAVFILPGNPASVHACAYVHVRAALALMRGLNPPMEIGAVLQKSITADSRRERLVRAALDLNDGQVRAIALPHQASHMLGNLPHTHAILRIPAGADIARGSTVRAWLTGTL